MSLVQLLAEQEQETAATLLAKHGADMPYRGSFFAEGLRQTIQELSSEQALALAAEAVATRTALRHPISPKGRFDERFADFERCLLLDGYAVTEEGRMRRTAPSLAAAPPVDDDLIAALQFSAAPSRNDIVRKVQDSAQAFRNVPPDYNAALTNARVALETMARDVAADLVPPGQAASYNPAKWGQVLGFLRARGEISLEEEGLAGVYRFVSPGAHRSVGGADGPTRENLRAEHVLVPAAQPFGAPCGRQFMSSSRFPREPFTDAIFKCPDSAGVVLTWRCE